MTYAAWTQRVAARLIDGLILLLASIVLSAAGGQVLGGLLTFVFSLAYYGFLNGEQQQTAGKRLLGIMVVDEATGGHIGLWRGVARELVPSGVALAAVSSPYLVPIGGLLVLADVLWPLKDRRRQALHDKVAKSLVVPVPASVDLV